MAQALDRGDQAVQEKIREFEQAVNGTAHEIENWLATDESKSVGQEDESGHIKD